MARAPWRRRQSVTCCLSGPPATAGLATCRLQQPSQHRTRPCSACWLLQVGQIALEGPPRLPECLFTTAPYCAGSCEFGKQVHYDQCPCGQLYRADARDLTHCPLPSCGRPRCGLLCVRRPAGWQLHLPALSATVLTLSPCTGRPSRPSYTTRSAATCDARSSVPSSPRSLQSGRFASHMTASCG